MRVRVGLVLAGLVMLGGPEIALADQGEEAEHLAEPLNNPGEWVTPPDYPLESLINGRTGITAFRLSVDTKGMPASCEVLSSSNDPKLDAATCSLVSARARFKPFRDEKGRLSTSTYSNRVRWVLPSTDGSTSDGSQQMTVEAELSSNGVIERCRIVQKDDYVFKPRNDPCPGMLGQQAYAPDPNRMMPRLKMRIVQTVEFEVLK